MDHGQWSVLPQEALDATSGVGTAPRPTTGQSPSLSDLRRSHPHQNMDMALEREPSPSPRGSASRFAFLLYSRCALTYALRMSVRRR